METTTEQAQAETSIKAENKLQGSGSPYPAETILTSLDRVKEVISKNGTANPISKDAICVSLGKKASTLTLSFSTWSQYGILQNKHGKGYLPTDLYTQYIDHVYPEDQTRALLTMFKSAPLYAKIIERLNNEVLPPEEKFPILLKGDPYKINPNSAERASKVFFENARFLKIIDDNNRLRFLISENGNGATRTNKPPAPTPTNPPAPANPTPTGVSDPSLFELPIPLGGKLKAYIRYPLENLTKKHIKVIVKALAFIASSIEDENDNEDFEIIIKETKKEQS